MDILNKNQNLELLFSFHKNETEYKEYLEYLQYYYQKPLKQDKYERAFENGKLFLIDKKNPNKKIEIVPAKYGDLEILYEQLKTEKKIILEKISIIIEKPENYNEQDRELFNKLKSNYSLYNKKIIEIDKINKEYYLSIEKLIQKKINSMNETAQFYMKRIQSYKNINDNEMISKKNKNHLIKLFNQSNKSIPKNIDNIAKSLNIPSKIIELWFIWINYSYNYILSKSNLYKINDQIDKEEKDFELKNKYMLLKKPEIIKLN